MKSKQPPVSRRLDPQSEKFFAEWVEEIKEQTHKADKKADKYADDLMKICLACKAACIEIENSTPHEKKKLDDSTNHVQIFEDYV